MAKHHTPRSVVVAMAMALLSVCLPSWSQTATGRDPLIERFVGFWRTVTAGPVLVAGEMAGLPWEAPDHSGGGKARITRLKGPKLEAVQQGLAQSPKPLTVGDCHGARVEGQTGPIVVWLHDDWCVQIILTHYKTPASATEVPGLEIATRLERMLSGKPAVEEEAPEQVEVTPAEPQPRPGPEESAAPDDIPGATVEGPPKPTVSGLQLSLKVTADLRAVTPATRFPATTARIYALFDYDGFAAGATVRVVWTPKAGGQPTTVAVALKDTHGRGACYVAPKQGDTLAKGEWTVSVFVEGSAAPAASQPFTIE